MVDPSGSSQPIFSSPVGATLLGELRRRDSVEQQPFSIGNEWLSRCEVVSSCIVYPMLFGPFSVPGTFGAPWRIFDSNSRSREREGQGCRGRELAWREEPEPSTYRQEVQRYGVALGTLCEVSTLKHSSKSIGTRSFTTCSRRALQHVSTALVKHYNTSKIYYDLSEGVAHSETQFSPGLECSESCFAAEVEIWLRVA